MATFEQRESGYWQAKVRRKGWPAQSKTFRTKTAAENWARQVEAEMDRGAFVSHAAAERTTFAELAQRFRSDFAPHHYRSTAWTHKLARLEARLGEYSLAALTPERVGWYRDARLQDRDPRFSASDSAPRVTGATVKTEIDLLAKVLDVGEKEFGIHLLRGNPARLVRKPTGGAARERRLSDDEWKRFEAECRTSRNTWLLAAVLLSVETAMRQGELLALEWSKVDTKRRLVTLGDGTTKNGEGRFVPLTTTAVAILEKLPRSTTGLVIPLGKQTLYSAFARATTRAGVKDFHWHDLRHEALSRLAERGDLSLLELAAVSGHKTLQMLRRYTHVQAERLAQKLG